QSDGQRPGYRSRTRVGPAAAPQCDHHSRRRSSLSAVTVGPSSSTLLSKQIRAEHLVVDACLPHAQIHQRIVLHAHEGDWSADVVVGVLQQNLVGYAFDVHKPLEIKILSDLVAG